MTKCYIVRKRSIVMKPLKTKVSITLDIDLVEQLKGLAEAASIPFLRAVIWTVWS